jgi:putative aldouronate transport system substrate-binding protein
VKVLLTKAKKILAFALALTTVSVMMVGCKKAETPSDSGTSGPLATLTVEVFDRGKAGQAPLDNNYWTKWINDNFGKSNNATVQFIPVPRTQEVDKLNVLMAANTAPDICFTYDQGTVYNYVKQDGLAQLDSPLSKVGPALSKYLGKDVLKYGTFNGKLYSIPAKRTIVANLGTFIRKDWLDKLGLPLPKTRDDFYNDLVAFRDKNPGGVTGVIPYAYAVGSGINIGTGNLMDSFVPKLTEEQLATLYTIGSAQANWNLPGYKDYVKFMNKLYNENLISHDFAIDKTQSQAISALTSGKAGAVSGNWDFIYRASPGIYSALKKNVPTAEFVPVDCFQDSQGKYTKQIYTPNGAFIMIPKASKNVDLAVKYLNWMSDSKVTLFLQNGQEGVDYNLVDGIPKPVQPSTLTGDKQIAVAYNGDYDMMSNGIELGSADKNTLAISAGYPGFENDVKLAAKLNMTDSFTLYYHSIPNTSFAKYSQTLADKSLQMLSKLITAKPADYDSLFNGQLSEYMSAGGQTVLDEYKANYKTETAKK